jgi:hypothetical protein
MNDIIHMARAVDPVTALLLDRKEPQGMDHETFVWFLERFAALVRADEREQCAKVCEYYFSHGARDIADAIRARGTV